MLSFCRGFEEKHFGAGDVILREGERNDILYILIEGEVEILKDDFQINTASEPGAIFGEISVLLSIPHTVTVRAVIPCRVYVAGKASEFIKTHKEITYHVCKLLAQRLQGLNNYLVDIKKQFADRQDHLGIVDEVLETLMHQQNEVGALGFERDSDPTS